MRINVFFVALAAIAFVSCKDYEIGPTGNSSNRPGPVTNVEVFNQPGQAEITYMLPTDEDLLYVKAVYTLNSGAVRETKASYYTNTMVLDGFGDTNVHEVKVYTVNRSGVESEPVIVPVKPLENPIWDVRRSLEVKNDFSGFNVRAENPTGNIVAIEMMMKDSLGIWRSIEGIETRLAKIDQSKRGFDSELSYEIGLTVRDRFLNYTDTLYTTIDPLFEEMLDKSKFRDMRYQGDAPIHKPDYPMSFMWNNNYSYTDSHRWLTNPAPDIYAPQVSTIDLGVPVTLSRIVIFNWGVGTSNGSRLMYYDEHLRRFEIWGMLNLPANTASFDGWTKLGDFENIKPSGLPYGEETGEDLETAIKGFDYSFPIEYAVPVRYIRLVVKETWKGLPIERYGIAEIDVWGDTNVSE